MRSVVIVLLSLLFLSSCGRKSKVHPPAKSREHIVQSSPRRVQQSGNKTAVPMRYDNGVYYVNVRINGVDMEVIFDTGASDIVISSIEAAFLLKQGKLTEDDVMGQNYYQVADGSISSGTVVLLRSVQIGTKVLSDVRATVVDNASAPLLLGQSALAQFSTISIDYQHNTLYIE